MPVKNPQQKLEDLHKQVFDLTRKAPVTGWRNSCGLTSIDRILVKHLLAGDLDDKLNTLPYRALLDIFRETYGFSVDDESVGWDQIKQYLERLATGSYAHPFKIDAVMAPVLAKFVFAERQLFLQEARKELAKLSSKTPEINTLRGEKQSFERQIAAIEAKENQSADDLDAVTKLKQALTQIKAGIGHFDKAFARVKADIEEAERSYDTSVHEALELMSQAQNARAGQAAPYFEKFVKNLRDGEIDGFDNQDLLAIYNQDPDAFKKLWFNSPAAQFAALISEGNLAELQNKFPDIYTCAYAKAEVKHKPVDGYFGTVRTAYREGFRATAIKAAKNAATSELVKGIVRDVAKGLAPMAEMALNQLSGDSTQVPSHKILTELSDAKNKFSAELKTKSYFDAYMQFLYTNSFKDSYEFSDEEIGSLAKVLGFNLEIYAPNITKPLTFINPQAFRTIRLIHDCRGHWEYEADTPEETQQIQQALAGYKDRKLNFKDDDSNKTIFSDLITATDDFPEKYKLFQEHVHAQLPKVIPGLECVYDRLSDKDKPRYLRFSTNHLREIVVEEADPEFHNRFNPDKTLGLSPWREAATDAENHFFLWHPKLGEKNNWSYVFGMAHQYSDTGQTYYYKLNTKHKQLVRYYFAEYSADEKWFEQHSLYHPEAIEADYWDAENQCWTSIPKNERLLTRDEFVAVLKGHWAPQLTTSPSSNDIDVWTKIAEMPEGTLTSTPLDPAYAHNKTPWPKLLDMQSCVSSVGAYAQKTLAADREFMDRVYCGDLQGLSTEDLEKEIAKQHDGVFAFTVNGETAVETRTKMFEFCDKLKTEIETLGTVKDKEGEIVLVDEEPKRRLLERLAAYKKELQLQLAFLDKIDINDKSFKAAREQAKKAAEEKAKREAEKAEAKKLQQLTLFTKLGAAPTKPAESCVQKTAFVYEEGSRYSSVILFNADKSCAKPEVAVIINLQLETPWSPNKEDCEALRSDEGLALTTTAGQTLKLFHDQEGILRGEITDADAIYDADTPEQSRARGMASMIELILNIAANSTEIEIYGTPANYDLVVCGYYFAKALKEQLGIPLLKISARPGIEAILKQDKEMHDRGKAFADQHVTAMLALPSEDENRKRFDCAIVKLRKNHGVEKGENAANPAANPAANLGNAPQAGGDPFAGMGGLGNILGMLGDQKGGSNPFAQPQNGKAGSGASPSLAGMANFFNSPEARARMQQVQQDSTMQAKMQEMQQDPNAQNLMKQVMENPQMMQMFTSMMGQAPS